MVSRVHYAVASHITTPYTKEVLIFPPPKVRNNNDEEKYKRKNDHGPLDHTQWHFLFYMDCQEYKHYSMCAL